MVRKSSLYSFAKFIGALVGGVAGFGGVIAVYAGTAEPYLAASAFPESSYVRVLIPGVLGMAGLATGVWTVSRFERRAWVRTGRAAGLSPESGSGGWFSGKPAFTGRVRGRPVRVYTRTVQSGGHNSSRKVYTVAEAGLNEPADEGVLVGRTDTGGAVVSLGGGDGVEQLVEHLENSDAGTVVRAEPYLALATSEPVGRAVVSGRSREALAGLDGDGQVRVGDVEPVMRALTAGVSDVPLVSTVADKLVEKVAGDPRVATTQGVRGLVLDGDRLERQVEAVVAAADAFEEAAGRGA